MDHFDGADGEHLAGRDCYGGDVRDVARIVERNRDRPRVGLDPEEAGRVGRAATAVPAPRRTGGGTDGRAHHRSRIHAVDDRTGDPARGGARRGARPGDREHCTGGRWRREMGRTVPAGGGRWRAHERVEGPIDGRGVDDPVRGDRPRERGRPDSWGRIPNSRSGGRRLAGGCRRRQRGDRPRGESEEGGDEQGDHDRPTRTTGASCRRPGMDPRPAAERSPVARRRVRRRGARDGFGVDGGSDRIGHERFPSTGAPTRGGPVPEGPRGAGAVGARRPRRARPPAPRRRPRPRAKGILRPSARRPTGWRRAPRSCGSPRRPWKR